MTGPVNPYPREVPPQHDGSTGYIDPRHAAFDEGVAAERVRLLGMLRDPDEEWMQHLRFVSAIDRDQLLLLADVLSARLTDPKEDA